MDEWMEERWVDVESYMLWCFDNCCYTGTADTPCFNKSVIGGTADIFSGADNSFIIDISNDSFPKGHQVDISVSLNHSRQFEIPKGYKILSQTFKISASEKLQKPVNLTLEHNAVISTEEEAKSLVILHRSDKGKTEILNGSTEPNCSFITIQMTEFCQVAVAAPNGIYTKYLLSFYRLQLKIHDDNSNPYLNILTLISQSNTKHEVLTL